VGSVLRNYKRAESEKLKEYNGVQLEVRRVTVECPVGKR
jgi:hypothetical protein